MSFQSFDERTAIDVIQALDQFTTPGAIQLVLAASSGARLDVLQASNSDVVDHIIWLSRGGSGDAQRFGSVNIPARAGFDGTAAIDLLSTLTPASWNAINLAGGDALYGGTDDTLAGAVVLPFSGSGGQF